MIKKNSKALALAIALVFMMASALAGCGQSGGGAATTAAATTAAAAEAATTAAPATTAAAAAAEEPAASGEYSTRVTLSHNISNAEQLVDNPLYDFFSEKFQVDMQYIQMSLGEHMEKTRIWVASGDLPDILWLDLNENIFNEWCNWVDSEVFRPVPSDLSNYPALKDMLDSGIATKLFTRNGDVYALPAMRDMASADYTVCMGITYRADWAEALGMRKEDDIYTWQEFIDLVRACIEQDPGGNGEGKTFGLSAPQWYFPDMFGIYQTNTYEWGFEEPFFIEIGGEYVWYPTTEEYIKGLKVAKGLFDEGIIWHDNIVDTNSAMYIDMYYAGQMVGTGQHATISNLTNGRNRMKEAFPDIDREKSYMIAKIASPFDDNFFWQKQSPTYWGANSLSATMSDEQLDRFLDIWNWLLTDEGMNFRLYGLEDIDFIVGADGKVEVMWEKNELGYYVDPHPGTRGFYGRPKLAEAELAYIRETVPLVDREDGYKSWRWDWENAHVGKVDYNMLFSSTPNKDTLGMFVAEVKAKAIELMINSSMDDLESEWSAWTDSMMPKVQLVLDDLNALPFIPTSYAELIEHMKSW
ncbi:MAG: hypothetical protein FWH01_06630 [Oscillospiraceae bacterium]|nr:hypothetical protein [Oscillospiraceae bacterium]